jgi:hypothetical protein
MTPAEYDLLERAILQGERVALRVRGAELVIVPLAVRSFGGRERVETRQPTTGEPMQVIVDDIESLELVR